MRSIDYIPSNNIAFCDLAERVFGYSAANHEQWGVEAPPDLSGILTPLKTLAQLCASPQRMHEAIVKRNTLRREAEDKVREYLQGHVMHNKKVTGIDRVAMGLPSRDTTRMPVGDPVGQAEADISYPGRGQLLLHLHHVADTPYDRRANYGRRIYYGVFEPGRPLPVAGKELHESRFARHKKQLIDFEQTDSGKTAFFCIRYENSKGKSGPWGPMFSAVIP